MRRMFKAAERKRQRTARFVALRSASMLLAFVPDVPLAKRGSSKMTHEPAPGSPADSTPVEYPSKFAIHLEGMF